MVLVLQGSRLGTCPCAPAINGVEPMEHEHAYGILRIEFARLSFLNNVFGCTRRLAGILVGIEMGLPRSSWLPAVWLIGQE